MRTRHQRNSFSVGSQLQKGWKLRRCRKQQSSQKNTTRIAHGCSRSHSWMVETRSCASYSTRSSITSTHRYESHGNSLDRLETLVHCGSGSKDMFLQKKRKTRKEKKQGILNCRLPRLWLSHRTGVVTFLCIVDVLSGCRRKNLVVLFGPASGPRTVSAVAEGDPQAVT